MSSFEETIDATLNSSGELQLTHPSRLPAGPVRVTIRPAQTVATRRTLADVIRAIADSQRARGFTGRSQADIEAQLEDDSERDRELDEARGDRANGGS